MSAVVEPTLHERLAAVRESAARDRHRSPAAAAALLDARARQLARRIDGADRAAERDLELLLVQVGEERLGIPVDNVVAIARVAHIARLPRVAPPVYGVTPWRGRPLTVLSLASGPVHLSPESRLVVLGTGARASLGIVVDSVHDIQASRRADLSAAGRGPRHEYALGMLPDGLLVVNGSILLHPDTLAP